MCFLEKRPCVGHLYSFMINSMEKKISQAMRQHFLEEACDARIAPRKVENWSDGGHVALDGPRPCLSIG